MKPSKVSSAFSRPQRAFSLDAVVNSHIVATSVPDNLSRAIRGPLPASSQVGEDPDSGFAQKSLSRKVASGQEPVGGSALSGPRKARNRPPRDAESLGLGLETERSTALAPA